jgi:hypothetical protein
MYKFIISTPTPPANVYHVSKGKAFGSKEELDKYIIEKNMQQVADLLNSGTSLQKQVRLR